MQIGIDLGGTKIEAIVLDRGTMRFRQRIPTPAGDYRATLDAIAALVAAAESEVGALGKVGFATPGAISPKTDLIKNSNSIVLNGRPLDRDLERRLARPVRLENDANCLALSEAIDGAAAGAHTVFAVILGTGVGGGLVVGRQLIAGRHRIAGEWGHNPLPWPRAEELPGAACYCGKSGCIETFLSGAGLAGSYRQLAGNDMSAAAVAAQAQAGDRAALQCLELYRDRLARGLACVINILDPDMIVLGGGLSNIARLYDGLPALIARYAFSDAIDTPVVPARHGDSSGVRGAARLWPED